MPFSSLKLPTVVLVDLALQSGQILFSLQSDAEPYIIQISLAALN